ncbi:uracil-DNA glycosylase family protein [Trinickia soli]|uniref:uracil-DNA glycosylase family protein n=1 Tax=Trinickia soli TaxID=380675 RepID=UPI003FA381B8
MSSSSSVARLPSLLAEIRACRACEAHLPHGPRPVLQAGRSARVLVIGQAPGARVHASGVPWDDKSGERLRDWMGIGPERFYDADSVALVPMGYCYPGRGASGDLPPRPECAELWLDRVLAEMPLIRLTLLVGAYAQRRFLAETRRGNLTETVAAWRDCGDARVPLPHPSPRNQGWFKHHPWFERELLPVLKARVAAALADVPIEPPESPGTTGKIDSGRAR